MGNTTPTTRAAAIEAALREIVPRLEESLDNTDCLYPDACEVCSAAREDSGSDEAICLDHAAVDAARAALALPPDAPASGEIHGSRCYPEGRSIEVVSQHGEWTAWAVAALNERPALLAERDALRQQVADLREALRSCIRDLADIYEACKDGREPVVGIGAFQRLDRARAALAKVQP